MRQNQLDAGDGGRYPEFCGVLAPSCRLTANAFAIPTLEWRSDVVVFQSVIAVSEEVSPVIRNMLGSLAALFLLALGLQAAESPAQTVLHNEIKTLKAQKEATIKAVHAAYDGWIKRDRFTEEVLIEIRKALHIEEDALIALAPTAEEKAAIKAHYDELRAILRAD